MITQEERDLIKSLAKKTNENFEEFSELFYAKFTLAMNAYFTNKFGFAFITTINQISYSEYASSVTANQALAKKTIPYNFVKRVALFAGLSVEELEKWVVNFGQNSEMPHRIKTEISPADKLRLKELEQANHDLNEDLTDCQERNEALEVENAKQKEQIDFLKGQLDTLSLVLKNLSENVEVSPKKN